MKTNEQILERFLSSDSEDLFGMQRNILLCLLPYKLAKPYLDENYVMEHDNDTLPEEERWKDDPNIHEQLMELMPKLHSFIYKGDTVNVVHGFLTLRSWLWVLYDDFYPEVEKELKNTLNESPEDLFRKIANHVGYKPIVEDIAFEELPKDS